MQANSNNPVPYIVPHAAPVAMRADIIAQALAFLESDLRKDHAMMSSPQAVRSFLCLHNGSFEDRHVERFSVMWLNSQNGLIEIETLFVGTLTQTSVYPREVVRAGLRNNAASCVLCHNHPSGSVSPSRADEALTQNLKSALALVDIRVLDHIITSGSNSCSMAEIGLV